MMGDAQSIEAFGFTVAEKRQFDQCRDLLLRRDITDAEKRTAMRRRAALTAICQRRVFGR